MKIKNHIREIRKDRGITQIELAKMLGINSSVDRISRRENGLTYPHVRNLLKMIDIFNVDVREMYPRERKFNK